MAVAKKRGLGRSFESLLSSGSRVEAPSATTSLQSSGADETQREIALDLVSPSAEQPRRHFDEALLNELAQSIATQGVIQPILVRPVGRGKFEIVAGERRWRAAGKAGLRSIPAVVRELDDRAAMAVALVENMQRADLNPLEEAESLQKLIGECGLTHEQVAEAIGKSRTAVTNLLRIMDLLPVVQAHVREGRLTLGHAKVLLGADAEQQESIATAVIEKALSVRATERLISASRSARSLSKQSAVAENAANRELEAKLTQGIGLPVKLSRSAGGRGRVSINFTNESELQALLGKLSG